MYMHKILYILTFLLFFNISAEAKEIEEKVYDWISSLQKPSGLVEETENSNLVSLYSNSLAAIVYTYKEDYSKAKKIFLWFKRNKKELNSAPGGFGQFRDTKGFTSAPHRWMGDNCWLLIALNYYKKKTGDTQFTSLAKDIEKWIRDLQDQDGGLWGGYNPNLTQIEKNSEGNIDALNAISGFDKFHKNLFIFLRDKRWDKKNNVFTTKWPPYEHAPDLISWGYLALGNKYKHFLDFADRFMIAKKSTLGPVVKGIAFDLVEKDGIWIEVTGQMALAYKVAEMDKKAQFLIKEIEKMYVPSNSNKNIGGIVYSTGQGTMFGPEPLWKGADTNPVLGTSCWYLMAKWGIDAMRIGRINIIKGLKKEGLYYK